LVAKSPFFPCSAALESRYLIQQNITLDLSEQTVLSCDRLSGNQCGGGWPYSAMTGYMKSNGVTTEKSYPYVARNTLLCQRNTAWKFYKSAGETEPYMLNGDENALKNLVLKSPVVVGIYASQKFQLYHSGILVDDLCDSSSSPNHAG
jgi:KDEL-tailed cysteine endopeptidase